MTTDRRAAEQPYNVKGRETHTICEECGNPNLAHDRAVWADDGSSYCPPCRPDIAAKPLVDRR